MQTQQPGDESDIPVLSSVQNKPAHFPFGRHPGSLKFREQPAPASCPRAFRQSCNASSARHPSIRRMRSGKPGFGSTHRHWSIFSAVNDSPHRDALFSGRFLNGHGAIRSASRAGKISSRIRGTNPLFTFATKMHRTYVRQDVTSDDEFLFQVRHDHRKQSRSSTDPQQVLPLAKRL